MQTLANSFKLHLAKQILKLPVWQRHFDRIGFQNVDLQAVNNKFVIANVKNINLPNYSANTGYQMTLLDEIHGLLTHGRSLKAFFPPKASVSVNMSINRHDRRPAFVSDRELELESKKLTSTKTGKIQSGQDLKIITEFIEESKTVIIMTSKIIDLKDGSMLSSGTHTKFKT